MAHEQGLDFVIEEPKDGWRRWTVIGIAFVVVAAVVFIVYRYSVADDGSSAVEEAIEQVTVDRGVLTDTLITTGSAAAGRQSELSFPIGGQVSAVEARLGDSVVSGQVLARLNATDAERDIETAMANLELASLRLQQMIESPTAAQIAAEDASVKQARAALERLMAPPTEAEVAAADAALEQARAALERLLAPPTEADIAAADVAVEQAQTALERLLTTPSPVVQAESEVAAASRQVGTAWASLSNALTNYCDGVGRRTIPSLCHPESIPLSDDHISALNEILVARVGDHPSFTAGFTQLLQADAAYQDALDSKANAEASLELALQGRTVLDQGATDQELEEATVSLEAATARRAALDEPPAQYEIDQATAALQSALKTRAASDEPPAPYEIDQATAVLRSAEASLTALKAGPPETDIRIQEQSLRLAEIALQQAHDRLEDLTLRAPYSGVIASVGVVPGDQLGASTAAFVIMDPTSMGVDITVSESDLVGLEPGQLAVAEFESIEGQSYLLEIAGIDTNPTVTQGVVTYTVRAEIVNPSQVAGRGDEVQQLAALNRGAGSLAGAAFSGNEFGGSGGGGGGFGGGGAGRASQECIQRVLGRTPAGRGDITPDELGLIREECSGGGGAAGRLGGGQGADAGPPTAGLQAPNEVPISGMNASVTVLLDIKPDVLLVPSAAIRQQGRISFVYVPTPDGGIEQKDVTVGGTDGDRTEILSGLKEADVILMGAGLTALQAGDSQLRAFREIR